MIENASWLIRALFTLATLLAAGSCFIACFTAQGNSIVIKEARRLCAISTGAALVFASLWTVALAAEMGDEWQASLDFFYYELIWASPSADLLMLRGVAIIALLLWAVIPSCPQWIAMISATAAIVSFTRYGHALGDPQWLKSALLTIHLGVIAWWVAVVPILLGLLSASKSNALLIADRFAEQAKWAIPVTALSGLSFLGLQLSTHQWNLDTVYFRTILIKLIVVIFIMGIGAFNRFRLVPALTAGDKNAKEKLRLVLLLDGALFFTVILLSAWLTGPANNM